MRILNEKKTQDRKIPGWMTLLLTFGWLFMIAFISWLSPGKDPAGILISTAFLILWIILGILAMRFWQWFPLLLASLYMIITSSLILFTWNAENEEMIVPPVTELLSQLSMSPFQGFGYISESLLPILPTILAVLTLMALIHVLDRNKPLIIEDKDPIEL